jgi:hypothetical protein
VSTAAHPGDSPRPTLRLGFTGFWGGFDPADNFFTRLLARRYDVRICPDPDFLVFSSFNRRTAGIERHDCTRIFFTGENVRPDWAVTDWAFTFDYSTHPRHWRLPLWVIYHDPSLLVHGPTRDPDAILARKRRFCGFVVSNPYGIERNDFFRRLSRYKPVDGGGAVFNTLGHRVADKLAFLSECTFTISFENESHPGYTTEKLPEAMRADSIPIYWGDPLVGRDFNTRSFLAFHDSASWDDLVDRVVAVDRDVARQRRMLAEPWYPGNTPPACADLDALLDRFTTIIETPIDPVARRRGLARRLGLHCVRPAADRIRRQLVRTYRKLHRND